jgi:periplasmic protein TonB
MKRTLLTLISFLLFILTAKAQMTDSARNSNAGIFVSVQQPPQFPGGINQFYRFVSKTIRYPVVAYHNNTQGTVVVSMVVEKDGSLSQLKVVKGIGGGCDEEALRVVWRSSPWKPGIQNGVPVRVAYSVPISFTLANR